MPMLCIRTLALTFLITSLFSQAVMGWSTTRLNPYQEKKNTHLWILRNAINVMKLSEGDEITSRELNLLAEWKKPLEKGIHHADWLCFCNTFYLYGNHYYNPDTEKSFIPTKTAKDMGLRFFKKAGEHYKKGNLKKAFYCLGLSLHYVTDLTQPMHAALFTPWNITMPLYHSKFEDFAAKIQDRFTLNQKITFNLSTTIDPGTYIHQTAQQAKKEHLNILNKTIRHNYLLGWFKNHHRQHWQQKVTTTIGMQLIRAQVFTAQFIHLWFQTYVL